MGVRIFPEFFAARRLLPLLTVQHAGYLFLAFSIDMNFRIYFQQLFESIVLRDVWIGLIKSLVFANITVQAGYLDGLRVSGVNGSRADGDAETMNAAQSRKWREASLLIAQTGWFERKPPRLALKRLGLGPPPDLRGGGMCKAVASCLIFLLLSADWSFAQAAPGSPDRLWHSSREQEFAREVLRLADSSGGVDRSKVYSLPELIDFAEAHHPLTRVAWENASARAAAFGVARSELYPTLAAVALSGIRREAEALGSNFFLQTLPAFEATLDLQYTIFDFGARAGRIAAAGFNVLAADFAFNDTHREVINRVEQAYYTLLNTLGQEQAARSSLTNAQTVQEAAEERLKHGLATLPDVLEARSVTAQADYDLQAILGAEEIAWGNLATALNLPQDTVIRVQPLDELKIPGAISDDVDLMIHRAFEQRPDLLAEVAEIRAADARVKEARAAYYPALALNIGPSAQWLYVLQEGFSWGHTADLLGAASLTLNWTVFDGGARRNRLTQAMAEARSAEARLRVTRDQVADEVWTAYSNFKTALRQRAAAAAFLEAATKSYEASLESYRYGVRDFLDVSAAERTLARARSTDVLARTQILSTLADLAYRAADSIQPSARKAP
jgi:outer membrane protein